MLPTFQTHPHLGWKRLVGGPLNYPYVVFVVRQDPDGGIYIHAYSEGNGQRLDRPCTNPDMAMRRIVYWAQMFA